MTPLPYELFEMIESEKDRNKQIDILRQYNNAYLILLAQYIYDEAKFTFRLKKLPKYKTNEKGHPSLAYSNLYREVRKFYTLLDIEPQKTNINDAKLKNILVGMLEALPEPECKIIETMLAKRRLPYKGLTKKLFEEAFPGIFTPAS